MAETRGVCDCVREKKEISIMSELNVNPLLDDDSFDQLIEDEILNETMGKNFNNNAYVAQVRLFPADGPPTGDPFNGPRLVLMEGSNGERSVEEGSDQRASLVTIHTGHIVKSLSCCVHCLFTTVA